MANQNEELVGIRLDISPQLCENQDPRIFILKPISARTVEDVKRHVAKTFFHKERTSHFKFVYSGYRLLESEDALIFNAIKGPIEVIPLNVIENGKKKSPQPSVTKEASFLSSTPFPNGSSGSTNNLNLGFAADSLSQLSGYDSNQGLNESENYEDSPLSTATKRRRRKYRSRNKALIETIKESSDASDGNHNLDEVVDIVDSSAFTSSLANEGQNGNGSVFTTPGTPPSLKNSKVRFNSRGRDSVSKGRGPDTPALPKILNRTEPIPVVYDSSVFEETSLLSPIKSACGLADEKAVERSEEFYANFKSIKDVSELAVGDKIAFKITELGENYNPRLSKFREASIDSIESDQGVISLTYTRIENVTRNGIFELDEEMEMETYPTEEKVAFNLMVDPKLILHNEVEIKRTEDST